MAEYIEREALLKKAIEEKRFVFHAKDLVNDEVVIKTVYKDLAEFIKSIPAADVVKVKHGRCNWCQPGDERCGTCVMFFDYHEDGGSDRCAASVCDGKCAYYKPMYACPNCGARMDGE